MRNKNKKYAFTENLFLQLKQVPDHHKREIKKRLDFYINQYKELRKHDNAVSVAHNHSLEVGRFIEDELKNDPEIKAQIKCKKGCGFCCMQNVDVTNDETEVLLEYSKEQGIEIDWGKAERQSKHNIDTWKNQSAEDIKCVFLNDDNECSVYEYRPSVCRKLFVITEPKYCDIVGYPKHQVGRVNSIDAEILATAIGTAAVEFDTLPKMLLKYKK